MGTNFYIGTSDKEARDTYFGRRYELTNKPTWLYDQHISKTSVGWLPLFEASQSIQSVADIKKLYDTGKFIIHDEYGTEYDWEEFNERVLKFNGGVVGAIPREKIAKDPNSTYWIRSLPDYSPMSRFEYKQGRYASDYFRDPEGHEFSRHEFE